MEITRFLADEWAGIYENAKEFWVETSKINPFCAKVVDAFNNYPNTKEKVGHPYRKLKLL